MTLHTDVVSTKHQNRDPQHANHSTPSQLYAYLASNAENHIARSHSDQLRLKTTAETGPNSASSSKCHLSEKQLPPRGPISKLTTQESLDLTDELMTTIVVYSSKSASVIVIQASHEPMLGLF